MSTSARGMMEQSYSDSNRRREPANDCSKAAMVERALVSVKGMLGNFFGSLGVMDSNFCLGAVGVLVV